MKTTRIYIISGAQGEGKTNYCLELVKQLKAKGESVGGIVAPGFWDGKSRSAFELLDLTSNKKIPFAQREYWKNWIRLKGFYFNPLAIKKGESILRLAIQENDWIVLDELGKLDIEGHLWGPIFKELIQVQNKKWIISVRTAFVEDVIRHWQLQNEEVLHIKENFIF